MQGKAALLGALIAVMTYSSYAGEGHIRQMREPIRGQYLVMLDNFHGRDVPKAAESLKHRYGGKVDHVFQARARDLRFQ
jgi:hypothetical protein